MTPIFALAAIAAILLLAHKGNRNFQEMRMKVAVLEAPEPKALSAADNSMDFANKYIECHRARVSHISSTSISVVIALGRTTMETMRFDRDSAFRGLDVGDSGIMVTLAPDGGRASHKFIPDKELPNNKDLDEATTGCELTDKILAASRKADKERAFQLQLPPSRHPDSNAYHWAQSSGPR